MVKGIGRAAFAAALGLALGGPALASGDAHEHGGHEAKLVLDHGKKWPTDEPLREGMSAIRNAVAKDVKAIHAGEAKPEQYRALAKKVEAEVAGIVQKCKLEPEADAQLHIVIAELLAGAEAMQGKGKGKGVEPRAGAERVAKALNAYGEHFAHEGWKRL
ncbi:MAG: hypothetical protein AB7S87_13040 [Burkholderiales bacterium]